MFQTKVALMDDDGSIHHFGFSFVEAQRILFDVIGRVYNISQVYQSSPNDFNTKRVTVDIEDAGKTKIGITLWGSYVDQVVNFVSKAFQSVVVIVCQFCKIKEYAGTRSLSNSTYASRILINVDVEEIRQFHDSLLLEDINTPFNPIVGDALVTTSPIETAFSGWSLSPVDVLQQSRNGDVIYVLAHVLHVNQGKGWYKIQLIVTDDSESADITVFDRDAFNYLVGWPQKLDCFVGKTLVFKVGIKMSDWNDFKVLTVQRMTYDPSMLINFLITRVLGLSFVDVEASSSAETRSTGKRSVTDLNDDGQSFVDFAMDFGAQQKKIKF
ncbi:replication protein A 70 kDa DNA-binding subunit B-like [Senna tora]|uniref:Replication protein A 70 kDa DNA-binding subunit B-like n=1 Tax=Senna tora TaxID=362788 RepID=A0A834SZ85_9FABA|nr:replication protein A 70 kDa DNA-binding subunit B-like [Senna tora]